MCNIAGYVGTKPAAPILIELMRRQEGWDCGHYTGMATVHNGRFFMEKIMGDLDMFLAENHVEDFPGCVGFIHSRTPGKAEHGKQWAHPFVDTDEGLMYIVNGIDGNFAEAAAVKRREVYMELKKEGYRFLSATDIPGAERGRMPDGMWVHASDVVCQLVGKYLREGDDTPTACQKANCRIMSEVVALAMNQEEPDSITWMRINYPMFAGIADHGIYLATTPQAMPEDARNITLLSPLSSGRIYKDRIETKPFPASDVSVAPILPGVWKKCYEAMETALMEKEMNHDQLDRLIRPLFPEATCPPESAVNYAIMNEFEKSGRLEIIRTRVPGTAPGSTAPKLTARLK